MRWNFNLCCNHDVALFTCKILGYSSFHFMNISYKCKYHSSTNPKILFFQYDIDDWKHLLISVYFNIWWCSYFFNLRSITLLIDLVQFSWTSLCVVRQSSIILNELYEVTIWDWRPADNISIIAMISWNCPII